MSFQQVGAEAAASILFPAAGGCTRIDASNGAFQYSILFYTSADGFGLLTGYQGINNNVFITLANVICGSSIYALIDQQRTLQMTVYNTNGLSQASYICVSSPFYGYGK